MAITATALDLFRAKYFITSKYYYEGDHSMKNRHLALAVLSVFPVFVCAQTTLTVYGSFDGGVRYLNGVDPAEHSRVTMNSSGVYQSNRLGFRGVEDLGGGLNAHFNLESGFNSGTGELVGVLFNRSANVGIGGAWGSLDLGRQYTVNFKTVSLYDPFNIRYISIIPVATQGGLTRLSNDIQYTGTFGPVIARAEYALGEETGNQRNGASAAVGLSYSAGPFAAAAAYTIRKNNVTTAATPATATLPAIPPGAKTAGTANFENQRNWTLGGAYTNGPFRVAVGYGDNKQEVGAGIQDLHIKDMWAGGSYNVTPATAVAVAWYQTRLDSAAGSGRRNLPVVGATYALSKRTNFYFEIDHARYTGNGRTLVAYQLPETTAPAAGASANGRDHQTGVSVGLNHLF
jgi:predicted porin